MLLEICAGSLYSALAAQAGGAHRIELCDNLDEGGTTPSPGTIRQAVNLLNIPVFVLIRPRAGDFLYSKEEFESMRDDIRFCKEHGAEGVVLGILKEDGSVDVERTDELVQLARPMQVTFHRAFDLAADPFRALEDIIGLGIERVLTSGQAATAIEGAALIKELIYRSAGRISIMPGSGINEYNVMEIIKLTGAGEIHASLRGPVKSGMRFQNDALNMGKTGIDEYSRQETDPARVREMINQLGAFSL
jgi:copper homeostasis protein